MNKMISKDDGRTFGEFLEDVKGEFSEYEKKGYADSGWVTACLRLKGNRKKREQIGKNSFDKYLNWKVKYVYRTSVWSPKKGYDWGKTPIDELRTYVPGYSVSLEQPDEKASPIGFAAVDLAGGISFFKGRQEAEERAEELQEEGKSAICVSIGELWLPKGDRSSVKELTAELF